MTQMHETLTPGQIEDGLGAYTDAATQSGLEVIPNAETVPSPRYTDVALRLVEGGLAEAKLLPKPGDEVSPAVEVSRSREAYGMLGQYPGLRVLVGQQIRSRTGPAREVYIPGIVLPTRSGRGFTNIGCLTAPNDVQPEPSYGCLSDVQHALLMQVYAMQREGVGQHGTGDTLNAADVAHAAVIATTHPSNVSGLHARTHDMVEVGLAPSLTKASSLDIAVGHNIRQVREGVIGMERADKIIVVGEHQLPTGPLARLSGEHGAGAAAVGITVAAGKSRNDPAVTHLARNLEVMQEEMENK